MKAMNVKKVSGQNVLNAVGKLLSKNMGLIVCFMALIVMSTGIADATATVNTMWNSVMNLIQTWVVRLGLVVVLVGGIMFGLAFKNEDAEAKTRGVNTMIAGGIVTAVAALVTNLLIP